MKRLLKVLAPIVLVLLIAVPLVAAQGGPIAEADTEAGAVVFTTHCLACHQANGQGIPSAFPPLAQHLPELLAVEGGRAYVVNTVLWGLVGAIEVNGVTYNSLMQSWAPVLDDQQIADVLNYSATDWDNAELLPEGFEAFTAEEVAAQRATEMDSTAVHAERDTLDLD